MSGIDLSVGGWDGWYFGSYGRAKVWRLISPDGQTFIPAEILSVRGLVLDNDYLSLRVKQLQAIARPALSAEDFRSISCAISALQDFLGLFASLGGYKVHTGRGAHTPLNTVQCNQALGDQGRHNAVAIPCAGMDQRPHSELGAR